MLRCIFIIECGIALPLRYVYIRSLGIIVIPEATFVPNLVSFTASIAELAHEEKSRYSLTNSSSLYDAPGWQEPKLSLWNNHNISYQMFLISL